MCHFPSSSFTVAAFDNFGQLDKITLSGNATAHDTAVTVQEKPDKPLQKQFKDKIPLNNVTTLTKLSSQQLIQYTEANGLKF